MSTLLAKVCADFTTSLASSVSAGATTATLVSATDDDGVALAAGRYLFTIDGDNSQKEHISCTLSGTSLTSIKTVSRQGVETSGFARAHRAGASVKGTDFAHIKFMKDLLDGTTDLDSTTPLKYDGTATISDAKHLATKAYVDGVAIAGAPDSSTTVKGITKMSVAPASATSPIAVGDNDPRVPTQDENDALVGTSGTAVSSSNKLVDAADAATTSTNNKIVRANSSGKIDTSWVQTKFGGTGTDGPLSITSGTTTIDCANAAVVVKNYSSISITGTGQLAFSNPNTNGTVVILKAQGTVVLTSSATPNIEATALGGAAVAGATAGGPRSGSGGNAGGAFYIYRTGAGGGGAGNGTPGTAGSAPTLNPASYALSSIAKYGGNLWVGASGGAGGQQNASSGTTGGGGAGGGCVVIECGGALNFTGSIYAKGNNGGNASTHGGGGGGGAGGLVKILYNSLTANSGTITVSGGSGGTNISETGADGGGGGGNGISAGTAGTSGAGTGGAGASGYSSVEQNNDYM